MTKRISKSKMRTLTKELRSLAAKYGCKIKLYRRPIIWNRYESGKPNFGEVRGNYAGKHKEIVVTAYGRPARRAILATIAHEVRHAEHDVKGLFAEYYQPHHQEALRFIRGHASSLPQGFKRPCNKTAFLAENDCNKWADKFLVRNGIEPMNEKYDYRDTMSYHINSWLNRKI